MAVDLNITGQYKVNGVPISTGGVTSVTGTAPVVSSGGATPAISMPAATTSVDGYLTSTNFNTFNGKQAALVSGTNIKTVNGTTLLGSGDLVVGGASGPGLGKIFFWTDFLTSFSSGYLDGYTHNINGGQVTVPFAINNRTNQQGVVQWSTGTGATNFVVAYSGFGNPYVLWFGGGTWSYQTSINITTLSTSAFTGGERYEMRFGFGDSGNANAEANGAIFMYDALSSANWLCQTMQGGVTTSTTTATVVAAATWIKLRIEINAAGTSVAFYINGTLVATHTTNIPLGSNNRFLMMKMGFFKKTGTTARILQIDYVGYESTLTTPR
jgi:hypothetical protein